MVSVTDAWLMYSWTALLAMKRGADVAFNAGSVALTGLVISPAPPCVYRNWLLYTAFGSKAALAID
jgi:hypothetical protein